MTFNRHGHAATAKAVELYDEQRDLEPFEHELLAAVRAINMGHANMVGNAARQWGIGSIAYDAVVDLATRQQDADLTAALETYQAAVDAGDEVLELEFCEGCSMTIHQINGIKVRTSHDYPPIPVRSFDWSAVDDDTYDCDCDGDGYFSTCPVGRGATEAAAIADLLEQIEESAA